MPKLRAIAPIWAPPPCLDPCSYLTTANKISPQHRKQDSEITSKKLNPTPIKSLPPHLRQRLLQACCNHQLWLLPLDSNASLSPASNSILRSVNHTIYIRKHLLKYPLIKSPEMSQCLSSQIHRYEKLDSCMYSVKMGSMMIAKHHVWKLTSLLTAYIKNTRQNKRSYQHFGKKRATRQKHLPGSSKLDCHFGSSGPGWLKLHPSKLLIGSVRFCLALSALKLMLKLLLTAHRSCNLESCLF